MRSGHFCPAFVITLAIGCSNAEPEPEPAKPTATFCQEFSEKLATLHCKLGGRAEDIIFICTGGQGTDTRCQAQYQTLLRCQMATASCAADGSIAFEACDRENKLYATCRTPSMTDAGAGDADGDVRADGDGSADSVLEDSDTTD